jgi:hypothetical protein
MMIEHKFEVTAELQVLAEKTIDQAERAFGLFFDAARKSTSTASTPLSEVSKLVLAFSEESLRTNFECARRLTWTSCLHVQTELVRRQIGSAQQHIRELASAIEAKDQT